LGKLHDEELHNLFSSTNIIRMIKLRRMRWAGNVARMGENRNVHRNLEGNPGGKRPQGKTIRKWERKAGSCERGNEYSGSVKY
jgi:hypothetical protein